MSGRAALLAALALLAACSPESATDRQRVIRIAVPLVPPAIGNPYQGVTIPTTLALQGIFDTVTMVDAAGNPTPGLAIAWEQQDPLHWVFRLRPGVTFSNGEPLTADALVESARHMASKRGRAETIGSTLAQVVAVERLDDLAVRIVLEEPDPLLPLHASIWRVPAPAHWRTLELPAQARNAIGSGPFVLAGREEGRLVLKANPRAWRQASVPVIELLTIPDATARLQAFVSGAVDIAMVLSRDNKPAAERGGGRMVTRLTPQVDFIGFLTERRDTPLHDPRVRRALGMAIDRALLTEHLLGGATRPASQLSVPGAFGFDPTLAPLPHDPAQARQLLVAAGHADGLRLKMIVTTGEVAGDTVYFQQIGSDLRKVGVEVEIRNRPSTRQLQELFSGNLQGDLFSFNTRGTDPLMDFRHRSCLHAKAGRLPFHCDPALTALLRQTQGEQDLARRRQRYAEIAAYERDHPPGILLWQRPDFDAVGPQVGGYAPVQDLIGLEHLRRVAPRPPTAGAVPERRAASR